MNVVITRQVRAARMDRLAVLAPPCLLYALDLTVLNLAGPHLSTDLQLPDQLGQALLGAARQAFTQGPHLVFTISAAAAIGVAILAAILLRRLRPSSEPQARLDPERTQGTWASREDPKRM
jgi:hypothetical protein